ncbi:unnamed protein product, partial [Mesorhabditis belari]|uniref:Ras-GAP domain-containing protein n=1 Tax=Mesorhabditis belari TaxID=2138241 RepID=A0AAF3EAX4_9BILA
MTSGGEWNFDGRTTGRRRGSAATRPISQSISSHFQKQKPVEWISSLIQRYQDQLPTLTGRTIDRETRELLNTTHSCIINVSKHHLHLVLLALLRVLKAVNASRWTSQVALSQSRLVVLETLLACLKEASPPPSRNVERECCMKSVLEEMWALMGSNPVGEKAMLVVGRVGALHPSLMISRYERALSALNDEETGEDTVDLALSHITLMGYVTFEMEALIRILQLTLQFWAPRKEHVESVCNMLTSILWRWIERCPDLFSTLQHSPQQQISDVCDGLFTAMNTAELKRRATCWPVQMLLLAISPCSLEAIAHAETDSVLLPPMVITKRQFVDQVVSTIASYNTGQRPIWSAQLQAACHAGVNLCKCATYVNLSDFFVFNVVQQLIEHVKGVLLTGSRPREIERSVLVDCFVALFRLKFDNDVFRVCLTSNQPILQLVLVEALHIIASEDREWPRRWRTWWPKIDMVMSRSDQLRTLLMQVLEKVVEADPVPSGHLPLSVSRSWHKMSGRWRVERPSSGSLGSSHGAMTPADCSLHTILLAILRLITTQPTLLIRNRITVDEVCIETVVSGLVLLIDHPSLHTPSMQALLALHTVIPQWNTASPQAALTTFFSVSSHMLFAVCQKLIHFQTSSAEHVISWLRVLIQCRIDYLRENYHLITEEMMDGITYQSLVKFEGSLLPNLQIDLSLARHLSSAPNIVTAGRIALQKSVARHLRALTHANSAVHEAWHETLRVWELFTAQLVSGSKDHADFVDHVTRVTTGTAVTSSADAAASLVDAWSSMSGFLSSIAHLIYIKEPNHVASFISRILSVLRTAEGKEGKEGKENKDKLDKNDGTGGTKGLMCKCVKELLSYEVSPSLDHFLFHSIASALSQHSAHHNFVEHCIYIVRNLLSRRQVVVLRVDSTQQMLHALLLHSQQNSERSMLNKMTFTKKLCGLLQLILANGAARRIPPPLQSRLVEHLSSCLSSLPSPHPFSTNRTETLQTVLWALTKLLSNISIAIPTNTFNKLYTQLLDAFQEPSLSHSSPVLSRTPLEEPVNSGGAAELTRRTNEAVLAAIAALINANPDLGVVRAMETSWSSGRRTRGWALDALSRVLRADSPARRTGGTGDREGRHGELLRLLTMTTEDGSLPLVSSLANSIPLDSPERVCRVVVTAFSEKGRLSELLWAVLWTEAESAISPSTLYRGSSFAAKLIGYCFRVFGHAYLVTTLRPLIQEMMQSDAATYEIEPERMSQQGSPSSSSSAVACGIASSQKAAQRAFDLILQSLEHLPPKLRVLCRQLYLVINTRFPSSGLSALGKILFLRLFNPAIVTPYEMQLCSRRPSRQLSRGLMLVSKILQTTVNQPTTSRDSSMRHFAEFIAAKVQPVNDFLSAVVGEEIDEEALRAPPPSLNAHLLFNVHSLFLNDKQEIVRQLRYTCASSNLCSRVDALLQSLPDEPPLPPANSEGLDPTLPYFYQLATNANGIPIYALILRRLQNVEAETAVKTISERCARTKWICLLDGLCCYDPPHLQKLMSADSFAHIDSVLVLHCSTPLLSRLHDHFALFNTLHISFDPIGARIPLDSLPTLSRQVMIGEEYLVEAELIGAEQVHVTVKIVEGLLCISGARKWSEQPALVSDFYQCSDFEQLELIDSKTVSLLSGDTIVSLRLEEALELLEKISAVRDRQADADTAARAPFWTHAPQLVCLALIQLVDIDAGVRATAYTLLHSLATTLSLPITEHLQETPCVLVPSGCTRLVRPLVTSLIRSNPNLLGTLLPRILDHPNITLIDALKDSWGCLSEVSDEIRQECIAHLVSACHEGGTIAALICSLVWPRIGELDERVLQTTIDRLLAVSPISASLDIVQSLSSASSLLPSLIVRRCIEQLTQASSPQPTPPSSLPRLLAFLLVLTFDSAALKLEAHLPQILHVVACVAGSGSQFVRYATFAIVNNIFHSFGTNPDYKLNDEGHGSLGLFLRQLSSSESMRLFRVIDCDSGQAVVNAAMQLVDQADGKVESESERELEDDMPALQPVGLGDVHQLLTLIIGVLKDLEMGMDGGRAWISEWRTVARHWAFQGCGEMQIRSLIAFSCLAESISDPEMKNIIQILVQVVKRRDCLSAMAAVSLSLIRLHTLTASNSPIHKLIFWIAILMFQLEHATIYEYAIQLLFANLSNLDHMGVFEHTTSLEKFAMEARIPLEWDLKAVDQCAGLSFKANFNFALVGYLLKGLRQPYLSVKVVQLLQLLLRITAKSNHQDPYVLTMDNIPYLLALLPFDEKVQQRFRGFSTRREQQQVVSRQVLDAPWDGNRLSASRPMPHSPSAPLLPSSSSPSNAPSWHDEDGEEESGMLLDPTIVCGEQAQALAVTVLAILARSCPNVHLILDTLLEAVTVFPTVVPVIECLLDQRIVGLVQSCQSAPMLSTVVRLIETSALGESGSGPQQACSFLQQCGFAGLWRYAGAFLSPRASLQAINANLCSCLECILASI